MAVILPSTINGVPYSAEVMRRNMGAAFVQSSPGVVRSGVVGAAPAVSLSGSTVNVGAFNAVIGSAKGAYLTGLDSTTSAGSLGVADPTNGRLDRVVLEVLDPDNGGAAGVREGRLRIVPGTPAALPGLPALPANSLHVAQVQVPRAGGGNPVVTVDCQFTAATGAPIPVRSASERDALPNVAGLAVQRLDAAGKHTETWTGSQWRANYPGPFAMYTNTALLDVGLAAGAQIGPFRHAFPAGTFTKAPTVTFGVSNARLSPAWNNVSTTGFDLYLRNDSSVAAVAGGLISYIALQSDA